MKESKTLAAAARQLPLFNVATPTANGDAPSEEDLSEFRPLTNADLHLVSRAAPQNGTLTATCVLPGGEGERAMLKKHFRIKEWTLVEFYKCAFLLRRPRLHSQ